MRAFLPLLAALLAVSAVTMIAGEPIVRLPPPATDAAAAPPDTAAASEPAVRQSQTICSADMGAKGWPGPGNCCLCQGSPLCTIDASYTAPLGGQMCTCANSCGIGF